MLDSPSQPVVCVLGFPIAGNPAQFCITRALADLKLDWFCLSFEVSPDSLAAAIRGTEALRFRGALIAHPHQSQASDWLRQRSTTAHEQAAPEHPAAGWCDGLRLEAPAAGGQACWTGCHFLAETVIGRVREYQQRSETTLRATCPLDAESAAVISGPHSVDLPPPVSQLTPAEMSEPLLLLRTPRSPAKATKGVPVEDPLRTLRPALTGGLHPASLLIDLPHPNNLTADFRCPDLGIAQTVTVIESEVDRLVIALRSWTGQTPNHELIAEALEEYLAI